jgi:TusA-related sulfurtransferase
MTERITIDTLGLMCPIPIVRLAATAMDAPPGTLIEVLSDDAAAKIDIPAWCRLKGQEFLTQEDRERGWAFVVRTRAAIPVPRGEER